MRSFLKARHGLTLNSFPSRRSAKILAQTGKSERSNKREDQVRQLKGLKRTRV